MPSRSAFAALALLLLAAAPAASQVPAQLQFLGFRPGMAAVDWEQEVSRLGGTPSCTAARSGALHECRATLPAGRAGPYTPAIEVRAILMHERAAIVLLRARLDARELARWSDALEAAYGASHLRTSGGQPTHEWIRSRTMLRLTTRPDGDHRDVSVSLVDGRVLDGWDG